MVWTWVDVKMKLIKKSDPSVGCIYLLQAFENSALNVISINQNAVGKIQPDV